MTHIIRGARYGALPSNYSTFADDGTLRLYGDATAWDDLLTGTTAARTGVVTPTSGTGFRGDSNVYRIAFVNTQADELQFEVQFSHAWKEGSTFYPHVHFCPEGAGGTDNAARFVLGYRFANVDEQFPASESTLEMTKTWTGDKTWYHLIASNATGISVPTGTLSAIMKCRVYRDNTVTNNLAANVTVLYFDWHIEKDAFGSATEYTK